MEQERKEVQAQGAPYAMADISIGDLFGDRLLKKGAGGAELSTLSPLDGKYIGELQKTSLSALHAALHAPFLRFPFHAPCRSLLQCPLVPSVPQLHSKAQSLL
jgi:hypothetical protein